jgi:hypothetical protein
VPHTRVRHGHEGSRGAPRRVCGTLGGGFAPVLSRLGWPDGGRRRTGAVGGTHRVAPRSSGHRHASQLVSTKPLCEGHTRRTTRIGTPPVGQRAARGFGGVRGGGRPSLGRPCTLSRRMVASGTAQRAWRKPQWRTFTKPSGQTCWRHRRRNSMTSRCAVRRRVLPTCREVQGTVRSVSETRRRVEMATVKTEGAREVQAAGPWGLACLWPFQGRVQTWGAMSSRRPPWRRSSLPRARSMGASALTGTQQFARAGSHAVRSAERPAPGIIEWIGG